MRYLFVVLLCALAIAATVAIMTRTRVERTLVAAATLGSVPALSGVGSFPVPEWVPGEIVLEPSLLVTAEQGQSSRVGVAYVSNANHYITLATFGGWPDGEKWEAVLELECEGPSDRNPLWIWVRVVKTSWGYGTTYDQLVAEGDWLAAWSDGIDEFMVTGPGVYRVTLPGLKYWQDVRDFGLGLVAGKPYDSDGKTYRFKNLRLHLTRGE